MNRRTTLKNLLIASGGLITLPAWGQNWHVNDLPTLPYSFSVASQEMLTAVADTIIPAGNSIGALSVGVDKFLQKLIANCYEANVQENVKTQLAALDNGAKSTYGKSFTTCDQMQRQTLLEKLAVSENQNEKDFFTLIKSETIRGFNTSREVMLQYLKYKILPGHFHGCVDATA
ncbi:gluconate 2-dehydrogenase subunit 3 family protein [Chryseolinea sp. H1M3-3]|uniref:gluconate 2-dehydrogenase subunit 3 family protein n=1 Tax=Chryseolinea sp. H1M3-3 TaxID=3034144 RepID=UPI0023EB7BE6|nr:gluconate 2-dehydrogenase subunit 3 family protein [Chryseolinea sp. H1M3-3]